MAGLVDTMAIATDGFIVRGSLVVGNAIEVEVDTVKEIAVEVKTVVKEIAVEVKE